MTDLLVGRRAACDALAERLAGDRPGLIVITGPIGSGKSSVLRHAGAVAGDLGYRVLGADDDPVTIDRTSTMADVRRRLRGFVTDDAGEPGHDREEGGRSRGPVGRALGWMTAKVDENREIRDLIGQLAPAVILIDGYRPGSVFGLWFASVLVPWLQGSGHRVGIALADRDDRVESVEKYASLILRLGQLDEAEVREHLAQASQEMTPPLSAPELDRYVAVAAADPSVLSALASVFAATGRAGGGSEVEG